MSRPGLSWAFECLLLLFHKDYFELTIDISMCKVILEVEFFKKKYDLSNVKIFQKNSLFHPEMIRRPLFYFKDTKKIQVN